MKVYVSVDMEGVAGISHHNPTGRKDKGYPAAVQLMTGEANAAIDGAFAGGATEVLVNDSHGGMYNLDQAGLDPRAILLQGQKTWSMVAGAGPDQWLWRGPVRGLSLPGREPARDDRPPTPSRWSARRSTAGPQARPRSTPSPSGVGRSGGSDRRRRCPGSRDGRLVPMGRAHRRQGGIRAPLRGIGPSDRRPRPDPCRRRTRRPSGDRGRAAAARPRAAICGRDHLPERAPGRLRQSRAGR